MLIYYSNLGGCWDISFLPEVVTQSNHLRGFRVRWTTFINFCFQKIHSFMLLKVFLASKFLHNLGGRKKIYPITKIDNHPWVGIQVNSTLGHINVTYSCHYKTLFFSGLWMVQLGKLFNMHCDLWKWYPDQNKNEEHWGRTWWKLPWFKPKGPTMQ